jgi:hypothetical protein
MSFDNNNSSTSASHPTCHYSSKYEKWYWKIIETVEKRRETGSAYISGSVEEHHVIPECLYPENWEHIDKYWKVILTPREHYILHLLLAKTEITPYLARSVNRFLNNTKHPHLVQSYTNLPSLGKKITSKHGYNVPPYRNTATSTSRQAKDLWRIADEIYETWVTNKCGSVKLSTLVGVRRSTSVASMISKFKGGWIPSEDQDWLSFKKGW